MYKFFLRNWVIFLKNILAFINSKVMFLNKKTKNYVIKSWLIFLYEIYVQNLLKYGILNQFMRI